jgi:hypothetical protein
MGCNPIILLGQDLCYYDNRLYADSAKDSLGGKYVTHMVEDVDIYGNRVYTYDGFKAMRHDMEVLNLRYRHDIKMYNATEGGLNIHGIENVTFEYIIDKYIKNNAHNIPEIFSSIFCELDTAGSSCSNDNTAVEDFYKHVLEECDKVERIILEKETEFRKFEKLKARGLPKNRLDREIFYIVSFNKRLEDIKFYRQVLFKSIEQQLTYFKASANYISAADSSGDHEGAEIYERQLDAFVMDLTDKIQNKIATDLLGVSTAVDDAPEATLAGIGVPDIPLAGIGVTDVMPANVGITDVTQS